MSPQSAIASEAGKVVNVQQPVAKAVVDPGNALLVQPVVKGAVNDFEVSRDVNDTEAVVLEHAPQIGDDVAKAGIETLRGTIDLGLAAIRGEADEAANAFAALLASPLKGHPNRGVTEGFVKPLLTGVPIRTCCNPPICRTVRPSS